MSEDNEIVATYKALKATRKLKSVQMDKYLCRGSGCTLAVVFQVPGRVVCWVPGYKNSSKLNDAVSVASARAKNTLDGDRQWPEHGYNVGDLAEFTGGGMKAMIPVQCRHYRGTLDPQDVLTGAARPGQATRPKLL